MTQIMIHGQKVDTVFELIGNNESAMTYSLGWVLAGCHAFGRELAATLGITEGFSDAMHICLQEYFPRKGFTDIEIVDPGRVHIVIEAKRGFNIPSPEQLEKYADRLSASKDTKARKMLLVLAESDRKEQWLTRHVPGQVKQIEVKAISWRQFQGMAKMCAAKVTAHSEKRLLCQFIEYLEKVITMQNQMSNLAYVVSVSHDIFFKDTGVSFIDVIEKYQKYFHPIGNRWPIEPPNYIAFRYDGILQSIHHIESYMVIEDYQDVDAFSLSSPHPTGEKHYLYELGAAIRPAKEVRTVDKAKGYTQIQRSARCECFIDLLLTCDSVSEAFVKTKHRRSVQ